MPLELASERSCRPGSISAIDNATRGLINLGQLPVTCGLFFSLGHSTIVIVVVSFESHLPSSRAEICGRRT